MIACGLPIIAAKVGVFGNNDALPGVAATFQVGDPVDLSKKLRVLLSKPPERISGIKIPTWDDRALALADFLQQIIDRRT
jgi:glycosyltransferase involved in cell wall biosynthesis